ncbi:ADP-ribose pyrophosphatase [Marmoricola endophyticus]|uniref:ADP-ribose pyrophosphatase n=1 Tax=Marmoricola endophyticus TaxID=2040280 RepID=A0A917BKF1_9ACTN|nr:NUDIX hydrolase [Marmoricola endophyticus]GGF43927.1 ADP-ribose pyrophosphatase [Marmoricola endophyticus]
MVVTRPGQATFGEPATRAADVIAAGAVVVRKGRVLLVHRPKYDDWSFPKGKQDPGEHPVTTAVREVIEETGVEIRLGRPVRPQAYLQRDGRTKLVHYWLGYVVGDPDVGRYEPNREIDRVEWVPVEQAESRLTYPRDATVLEDALSQSKRTGVLAVLRHTKARPRKSWRGEDPKRPLAEQGVEQARAVVPLLSAYAVTRVVSSDSVRCLQTVAPYAAEHVLAVHGTPVLAEEHEPAEDVPALVEDLLTSKEPTVLCTHRPVLPAVLDRLGLTLDEPLSPGDLVVVHHRKGEVVAAELHPRDA